MGSETRSRPRGQRARPDDPFALNLARIVHRLLTTARGWRVDELKRELGISDRTWRKYRRTLQQRFTPLQAHGGKSLIREVEDGGRRWFRLVEGDDLEIDSPDLLACMAGLHLARQAFTFLSKTELRTALDGIYESIRARVRDKRFVLGHLFRNLDRMLHCVEDAPKDYAGQAKKLAAILRGLIFTTPLAITYQGAAGAEPRRHELEPLTLMMHRSALYVVARHVGDERRYTFAVDRIQTVEPVGTKTFRYPTEKDYSPSAHFEGAFGIFLPASGTRTTTRVELVFANERWLKLYVQERRWHPTQRFLELPDGRLRMTFKVDSMVEVWPWVRSFGREVSVVRPAEPGRREGSGRSRSRRRP